MKILVADKLAPEGIEALRARDDCEVDVPKDLDGDGLLKIIGEYDALIVRSRTKVTAEVIGRGTKLKVIGRAGVGLDNIDVPEATRRGVIVLNAPEGNTLSTCELAMGMMLALARNIPQAANSTRAGRWDKKKYAGHELHSKTLGIIGLGRIGSEVARRAAAFGMTVIGSDPYCTPEMARRAEVRLTSLDELLALADVITIHSPLTDETRNLIDRREFEKMKDGVLIVNCARGGIVNEAALLEVLETGKVAGCALDVFETEPPGDSPLPGHERVIATPHLGASTIEAQAGVAREVARRVIDALSGGPVYTAVNMPRFDPQVLKAIGPYIDLAEKMGRLTGQMADGPVELMAITCRGEMNDHDIAPITAASTRGLLSVAMGDSVNAVSAPMLAAERGIRVVEAKSDRSGEFANYISVEVKSGEGGSLVGGALFGNEGRIVRIDDYHVDVVPRGHLLICTNEDKPGAIRHLSTILANDDVNIASMTVSRDQPGGTAMTLVNIDQALSADALEEIRANPVFRGADVVEL